MSIFERQSESLTHEPRRWHASRVVGKFVIGAVLFVGGVIAIDSHEVRDADDSFLQISDGTGILDQAGKHNEWQFDLIEAGAVAATIGGILILGDLLYTELRRPPEE